jgi:thioredoxin-dependent peroxiredoxin
MTTLLIAETDVAAPTGGLMGPLQEWLQGNWAVLFSDPDDFAPHASTPHGFMACLADELRRARVKMLRVAACAQQVPVSSWLDQLEGERSLLTLPCVQGEQVLDFATRALVLKLTRLQGPYALILDERGRCRSTITYRPRRIDRLRTVHDPLHVIAALRGSCLEKQLAASMTHQPAAPSDPGRCVSLTP